jgi:hypothetical protein
MADVIMPPCAGVKLIHLGEHGGFWATGYVDPGESSGIKVLMWHGAGIREMARDLGCSRSHLRNTLGLILLECAMAAINAPGCLRA